MKFAFVTLALVGSALAVPHVPRSVRPSVSTVIPSYTPTPTYTPVSSTEVATPTSTCDVESDGDNGNHYGWCKKAKHYGTYKNGKSDGEPDGDGPN